MLNRQTDTRFNPLAFLPRRQTDGSESTVQNPVCCPMINTLTEGPKADVRFPPSQSEDWFTDTVAEVGESSRAAEPYLAYGVC